MVSISFAITVCNEHEELDRLLSQLAYRLRKVDEAVVQYDSSKVTDEVFSVINKYPEIVSKIIKSELDGDFSSFKNNLKKYCAKEYIFFIDADEYFSENLLTSIPDVLTDNPNIDMISIPRSNIVTGLTEEYVKKWGWRVDQHGRVNWPDYQNRLIRNIPSINWANQVHEIIVGHKESSLFPCDSEDWCLYHPKTIDRQVRQNDYYSTL